MNQARIDDLKSKGELRKRSPDPARAASLIQAAMDSAAFATATPLNEQTSTGIFKAVYDAFRQLSDARWWQEGYEAFSHKASIDLLKTAPVSEQSRLQQLSRAMDLRNDASYRGYRIPVRETELLIALWNETSEELIAWAGKRER